MFGADPKTDINRLAKPGKIGLVKSGKASNGQVRCCKAPDGNEVTTGVSRQRNSCVFGRERAPMKNTSFGEMKLTLEEACEFLRSFTLGRHGFTPQDGLAGIQRVLDQCDQMEKLFADGSDAKESKTMVAWRQGHGSWQQRPVWPSCVKIHE